MQILLPTGIIEQKSVKQRFNFKKRAEESNSNAFLENTKTLHRVLRRFLCCLFAQVPKFCLGSEIKWGGRPRPGSLPPELTSLTCLHPFCRQRLNRTCFGVVQLYQRFGQNVEKKLIFSAATRELQGESQNRKKKTAQTQVVQS